MEKVTVFLGGTCADSTWRDELIPMLGENIEYYNPVVPDWNEEAREREKMHRKEDDICLYTITPEGTGFYSFVEVTDDSNKRPARTVLCLLMEANGKRFEGHMEKCALQTAALVSDNGATVVTSLEELADYLNSFEKEPKQIDINKIMKKKRDE